MVRLVIRGETANVKQALNGFSVELQHPLAMVVDPGCRREPPFIDFRDPVLGQVTLQPVLPDRELLTGVTAEAHDCRERRFRQQVKEIVVIPAKEIDTRFWIRWLFCLFDDNSASLDQNRAQNVQEPLDWPLVFYNDSLVLADL